MADTGGIDIEFHGDGLVLRGLFHAGAGEVATGAGPRATIVAVHGYTGRKETSMPPFAREFTARGWNFIDFYHRGCRRQRRPAPAHQFRRPGALYTRRPRLGA